MRDFFQYKAGELHCENVSLRQLVKKFGSPLYVYSEADFSHQVKRFQKSLSNVPHTLFYAVKANSNLSLLKKLKALGTGVDLVSYGELFRAKKAGFSYEKMVLSGVGKTKEELRKALKLPLHSINVESAAEFKLILELVKGMKSKRKPKIAFRFNPDVNPKTHPYISTGLKENKFGLNRDEILDVLKKNPFSQSITVTGISVHIGSQIESLKPFSEAIERCLELVDELEKKFQLKIQTLDLGGGIAIPYTGDEKITIEAYGEMVRKYFGPNGKYPQRFHLGFEPGRRIIGSSGVLVTEVLFRKSRKEKEFLVLDAGMNDLLRPSLYESFHEIVPMKEAQLRGKLMNTDVVGPVCESSDRFARDRKLSKNLDSGDYLVILDAGAYGMSMASTYNSRPKVAEVLVSGKNSKLVRRRETLNDLIREELV
jgi:diaminopimelate decarboxylase